MANGDEEAWNLINLWYKDITDERLFELRREYKELAGHENDSRIRRFYDELSGFLGMFG